MINIVIPLAGKAERFAAEGYTMPKPLIPVGDKLMIEKSLSALDIRSQCRFVFIVRREHVNQFGLDKILKEKFSNSEIIILDHDTSGATETCLAASPLIDNDDALIIYTPDVYFNPMIIRDILLDKSYDGILLTFKANSPDHSYTEVDNENYAIRIAEKEVISDYANVGLYYFKRGSDFIHYARELHSGPPSFKKEYYIAPLYNLMIRDGKRIWTQKVDQMCVLGTPQDLRFYVDDAWKKLRDKPVALCADHSGYELKEKVKEILDNKSIKYIDYGTYSTKACDHYDFLSQAIREIKAGHAGFGFAFCATGQGFNIGANKCSGIRSAIVYDGLSARLARLHNCANFFCFPSKTITDNLILSDIIRMIDISDFDGGRHATRIMKLEKLREIY